ncbi:unnamed protein product [Pleuronectes platessa]|uniref:Uncharacterized protein n=1 Tax=Pleuronectes platessa TaxID=8262 RepID=A0A9N7V2Z3_PLEPL|nr:unnamed protein product [Pleuronectes platessa]
MRPAIPRLYVYDTQWTYHPSGLSFPLQSRSAPTRQSRRRTDFASATQQTPGSDQPCVVFFRWNLNMISFQGNGIVFLCLCFPHKHQMTTRLWFLSLIISRIPR